MPETIGQQLKQAREARNLTFKKVTQATRIQAHLLEAMENDDFESLPSPIQARAFLRIYAGYLELSIDQLITHQRNGSIETPEVIRTREPAPIPIQEQVPDSQIASAPGDEARMERPLPRVDKIKGFIFRLRQRRSQPGQPAEPAIPSEQSAVSGPPDEAGSKSASIVSAQVVSTQNNPETPVQPAFFSSERPGSEMVFVRIGEALRRHREALSLTLDEIENHTHVRKHYLHALEVGDFDHLPSSVQARGMLNNYAHFLDMDVDAILLKFAEGLQMLRLERQPSPVEEKQVVHGKSSSINHLPTGLRRLLSIDALVGGGLVLTLLVFAIWGTSRVITLRSANTPQPTAESISNILVALPRAVTSTPVATNAVLPQTEVPLASSTAIKTVQASGQGAVKIVLVALKQAYVRVTADGKKLFDGRISAGTAYPFDGNNQIEVLTGDGAAVSILFNQSDLGPMGTVGEVVDRIYTANAILPPTATFTPTPTISPTPSMTPRQSPTPRPSNTPQNPAATQTHG
jgi:cytoskeleton protein RodZ